MQLLMRWVCVGCLALAMGLVAGCATPAPTGGAYSEEWEQLEGDALPARLPEEWRSEREKKFKLSGEISIGVSAGF